MTDEIKLSNKKQIQSLARAAYILEFIAKNHNSASLTQISKNLGLSKSTVHGLISTLEDFNYVYQDQTTGLYQLGLKLFEMGQVVYASMDLRTIAYPVLVELSRQYEETVHLALLSGNEVVYIEKVDSSRSIRIISQIGGRNPTYCTGVGKVLLAGLPVDKVEKIVETTGMKKLTPNTIDNLSDLKCCLAEVAQQGYAFDLEEIEMGLRCIAAPIKNHRGITIAGISLSGPTNRLPDELLPQLATDVVNAAHRISEKLGFKDN
ncbi:IclR family transcriptional regulator [Sporomusa acidovorans]|uniref:HTH-type transcriptional regulator XynR n=1 Tax=Sporomusa acidovorans (strain ATCC 49682 / DSM 3132 / Mol) TaxID=1123286 RepID=A0ABZ3IX24_SPOA4|nr:IclR family transcriptional regulator [Sporomusa acidovorans]OZC13994.1 transcriptional regulator KdgR [Sporomusa acidovorans DSM 3132]SDF21985.1 transcriptional regulator, IclR family [Sporomusa acidovorans]